jgi:hypothetical protein
MCLGEQAGPHESRIRQLCHSMSKEGALLQGESGSNTERLESRKGAMDEVGVVRPLVMGRGFGRTGIVAALPGELKVRHYQR